MIRGWFVEALTRSRIPAVELPEKEVEHVVELIVQRFCDNTILGRPLWERLAEPESRHRSDGWSKICDFAQVSSQLLFQEDDRFMGFAFESGRDIRNLLSEMPGFEFYVTDQGVTYVLCHNHHDHIIGVGDCRTWLSGLSETE